MLVAAIARSAAAQSASPANVPPAWAYPIKPAELAAPPDDSANNRFLGPDWHPQEHPHPPDPVLHGRKPGVYACAYCHRADGVGGPENASLAGLTVSYMLRQLADFRSGARTGSEPLRLPTGLMAGVATAVSDTEVAAALAYFAARELPQRMDVVETDTVPVTHVVGWVLAVAPGGGKESLGQRIIEVPVDMEVFESRDSHARFTAYVPIGSVDRGKTLAATGGAGRFAPCVTCHGPALRGLEPAPGIAGRSPSYIVRQLYDFNHGSRAGTASAPMSLVAQQLTLDDMLALAAYVSSLPP